MSSSRPSVTIVGAGPTGLALAVELLAAGISFRLIDSAATPVHESRALAIQARTLEVLERDGIAARLVADGDAARVIEMHAARSVAVPLSDDAEGRTPFPFLLFLSQARTERILVDHLERHGVSIERNTRLVGVLQDPDQVTIDTETATGRQRSQTDFLIGCDGAHSAVRTLAGIDFAGSGFPQAFAIADLEVAGLSPGRVHAYLAAAGLMFFFPLREPASWRLLAMLPTDGDVGDPDLARLQRVTDAYTGARHLSLRDPVWVTRFQVQSRYARRFRVGRVLLAGDAAHIHSPAGAQGMNTGIQDAINLGWKLAQVVSGSASDSLLASYENERRPVARSVLRMTDRLFRMATSPNPIVRFARPRLAPAVLSLVTRSRSMRQICFRVISQIGISYRHRDLARSARSRRMGRLRAGDRLPPFPVIVDGATVDLRTRIGTPNYLLAVIGTSAPDPDGFDGPVDVLEAAWPAGGKRAPRAAWLMIRPDGYIAGIWAGATGARAFLNR